MDLELQRDYIVNINAGGSKRVFSTYASTLIKSSFFRCMLGTNGTKPSEQIDGCYFVDCDAEVFSLILEVLRTGFLPRTLNYSSSYLQALFAKFDVDLYIKGKDEKPNKEVIERIAQEITCLAVDVLKARGDTLTLNFYIQKECGGLNIEKIGKSEFNIIVKNNPYGKSSPFKSDFLAKKFMQPLLSELIIPEGLSIHYSAPYIRSAKNEGVIEISLDDQTKKKRSVFFQ